MARQFDAPIYRALDPWLSELDEAVPPTRGALNASLMASSAPDAQTLRRLIAPAPESRRYCDQFEVRCHRWGEIAYRENSWHDAFNAIAWLAFPRTKAAISRGHFEVLERLRIGQGIDETGELPGQGPRGGRRDTLTLFDEGGVIAVSVDANLLAMIQEKQWKELFWHHREQVSTDMRFFVLGHALHEKALHPYKEMTARAMLLRVDAHFLTMDISMQRSLVDVLAAEKIQDEASFNQATAVPPLPLMGIPGWCENQREAFYDDITVFRPKRVAAV